eukprot:TRINITY_DN8237_c1_g6_i1.p1 TRINITY_DN8237_c1_g6~~TRINITY_DN8237_c1_g6_i1.p1  ORF type:complete len:470 (+),score=31.51 TRINITY_DN8237_c1_g6_i1:78-1487(+)
MEDNLRQDQRFNFVFEAGSLNGLSIKKSRTKKGRRLLPKIATSAEKQSQSVESAWQTLANMPSELMVLQRACAMLLETHPQSVQAMRCTCRTWNEATKVSHRVPDIKVIRIDNVRCFQPGSDFAEPVKKLDQFVFHRQSEQSVKDKEPGIIPQAEQSIADDLINSICKGEGVTKLVSLVYLFPSDYINLKKAKLEFKGPVKFQSQHAKFLTSFPLSNEDFYKEHQTSAMRFTSGKYPAIHMPEQTVVLNHKIQFERLNIKFFYTTSSCLEASKDGSVTFQNCQFYGERSRVTAQGYLEFKNTEFLTSVNIEAFGGGVVDVRDCQGDMFLSVEQQQQQESDDESKTTQLNVSDCKINVLSFPFGTRYLAIARGGKLQFKDTEVTIIVRKQGQLIVPFFYSQSDTWKIFGCQNGGQVQLVNVTFKLLTIFKNVCVPEFVVPYEVLREEQVSLLYLLEKYGQQKIQRQNEQF